MKKFAPPAAIVLLLCSSFFSCTSVVHQGYKLLQKKEKDAAEAKFEKALEKPLEKSVAALGLFRLQGNDVFKGTYRELEALFSQMTGELEAFKNLPLDRKRFYEKKKAIKVTDKSFTNVLTRLQTFAMHRIDDVDSLLLLDTFLVNMTPVFTRNQTALAELEDSLVMQNLYSRHYYTLRSIAKNHLHVLDRKLLIINHSFRRRMWKAFLREIPLVRYREFVSDFPNHEYCDDCYMDDFLRVVESENLEHLANFLDTCRNTNTDEIVAYGLSQPPNRYLLEQLATLSPRSANRIREILNAYELVYYGFPPHYSSEEVFDMTKEYVSSTAPANRSYRVLVNGLRFLRDRRKWNWELELVQFAKSLFPDTTYHCIPSYAIYNKKQVWFEKVIKELKNETENLLATSLPTPVNSSTELERAPVVSVDDRALYFAGNTRSSNLGFNDVYKATKNSKGWTIPKMQRGVSSKFNEYPLALTADQDYMLIARDTYLLISAWDFDRGSWKTAKAVSRSIFDMPWVGNAALSRDGKVIIFEGSQDHRPLENEEDIDLYIMQYIDKDKEWGPPRPLSFDINTQFQERFPFLHADGKTLLFSSYGHYGFAWDDWFMSTRLDSTWQRWTTPLNMGKDLNGYDRDWWTSVAIPASGEKVYYQTFRDSFDLVEMKLPNYSKLQRMIVMKCRVGSQTSNTKVKVHSNFPLDNLPIDSCKILPKGRYQLLVPDYGQDEIFFYVDDPTMYSVVQKVEIRNMANVIQLEECPIAIPFSQIIARELPLPLQHMNFERGDYQLSEQAKIELQWAARYFVENKQTLLIGGYTDDEGNDTEQASLSLKRAERAKAYLHELGLDGDRIWTQGFADFHPIDTTGTAAGKQKNRRIAIFLKKP